MATEPLLKFLSSKAFAVIGASKDPDKYGNIILKWYIDHNLPVHPVNPSATEIEHLPVVKSISDLENPSHTSLSFLTPPKITLKLLQEARERGVQRVWLQPGSYEDGWMPDVEGMGFETVIARGRCILREGEQGLKALKREAKV